MKAVVFLGPTLAREAAAALFDATYLPPVAQGGVYRAVRDLGPAAIGIVDGAFHQVPAVWHREILFALSEGIHVFGAASMGALRGAELHSFGMRPVGKIAEAYRNGTYPPYDSLPFDADDEVAIIHGPAETGYLALSEALVDIRETLALAAARAVITPPTRDRLVQLAAAIFYQERGYDRLVAEARAAGLDSDELARLSDWLPGNRVSQKQSDATALLQAMDAVVRPGMERFKPAFRFERAAVWERFRSGANAGDEPALSTAERIVIDELRHAPDVWRDARRKAATRIAALRDGVDMSMTGEAAVRRELDRLRERENLPRRVDLDGWMARNAIDSRTLARLMHEEAALAGSPGKPSPRMLRGMVDIVRLDGRFAAFLARGEAKQALAHKDSVPFREGPPSPASLASTALHAWYFEERLGYAGMPLIADHIVEFGYKDEIDLMESVIMEYTYVTRCGG